MMKSPATTTPSAAVAFFGQKFRAYGSVTQGMEAMIPLRWNKKVKVERYE